MTVDVRALWRRLEAVHAVTYFGPETREALKEVGLKGFWMGYFGARAAPLGPVGADVVTALFFNFHPSMVRRAVPDTWGFADPGAILDARRSAAAATLRRIVPDIDQRAEQLAPPLQVALETGGIAGRPLFGANRSLPTPSDRVEALWQATTCLREHRGDGHVAALVAADVDGCEAHQLKGAADAIPESVVRENRGWSVEDWAAAAERLENRGLVEQSSLTDQGQALQSQIEQVTDNLAAECFKAWSDAQASSVLEHLDVIAEAIVSSDMIPFPNPMGLPRP